MSLSQDEAFEHLRSQEWRLSNLYKIKDKEGNEITRGLISGTGGDVGTTTGHDKLAGEMGLGGSVHENNDNIMSLGSTVRPQHYATFMLALHNVTGVNDWKVKV